MSHGVEKRKTLSRDLTQEGPGKGHRGCHDRPPFPGHYCTILLDPGHVVWNWDDLRTWGLSRGLHWDREGRKSSFLQPHQGLIMAAAAAQGEAFFPDPFPGTLYL